MRGHWIAVASAEHVRRGQAEGFMQVCHGRAAPLRRIQPGDGIAYYSPTTRFAGGDRLQAFTAIGLVRPGDPYRVDMGGGFHSHRRDVAWAAASDASMRPLLGVLDFTASTSNWGHRLRFGLLAISPHDFRLILAAMNASLS